MSSSRTARGNRPRHGLWMQNTPADCCVCGEGTSWRTTFVSSAAYLNPVPATAPSQPRATSAPLQRCGRCCCRGGARPPGARAGPARQPLDPCLHESSAPCWRRPAGCARAAGQRIRPDRLQHPCEVRQPDVASSGARVGAGGLSINGLVLQTCNTDIAYIHLQQQQMSKMLPRFRVYSSTC